MSAPGEPSSDIGKGSTHRLLHSRIPATGLEGITSGFSLWRRMPGIAPAASTQCKGWNASAGRLQDVPIRRAAISVAAGHPRAIAGAVDLAGSSAAVGYRALGA